MSTNRYQKILRAVRRWFEGARFPAEPVLIPVKVRIDEAAHYRPMNIREFRALQQRFKR
jgi:hypothetical protein